MNVFYFCVSAASAASAYYFLIHKPGVVLSKMQNAAVLGGVVVGIIIPQMLPPFKIPFAYQLQQVAQAPQAPVRSEQQDGIAAFMAAMEAQRQRQLRNAEELARSTEWATEGGLN